MAPFKDRHGGLTEYVLGRVQGVIQSVVSVFMCCCGILFNTEIETRLSANHLSLQAN